MSTKPFWGRCEHPDYLENLQSENRKPFRSISLCDINSYYRLTSVF